MMNNEEFLNELDECKTIIETHLDKFLTLGDEKYATLIESMRYSLLDGGKRIRGIICLKFCEAVCGSIEKAIPAACAIEMLHSYTLIHDDLPCMDDDEMRRGKPSNHIKYGEYTAVLAGDAMQAMVFQMLLSSKLPAEVVVTMGQLVAGAGGPHGVCAGQYLDLSGEGRTLKLEELMEIYALKTSSLICTAACLGVVAAGGTPEQFAAAGQYAGALALAFQVRDDILDCIGTEEELGKPIGSDSDNKKTTMASLLGVNECEKMCNTLTQSAISAIEQGFGKNEFLEQLVKHLEDRRA